MILTFVFALILAKIKKQKLSVLFKAYALYPVYLSELFVMFLQANVFLGNFYFSRHLELIKMLHLGLYIIPVIAYGLYKQALVGSAFVFAGTALNKLVMHANGGKMPVYPSLSRLTGYFSPEGLSAPGGIHSLGGPSTKLAFLADYIDVGYSVLSIGDLIIRVYIILILYYTIVRLNRAAVPPPRIPSEKETD